MKKDLATTKRYNLNLTDDDGILLNQFKIVIVDQYDKDFEKYLDGDGDVDFVYTRQELSSLSGFDENMETPIKRRIARHLFI